MLLLLASLPSMGSEMDSVSVALITCGPGTEVYAQYGHTALRVQDRRTGMDVAVNYGMFSSHQPWFVLRFILGLTDYRVDCIPFNIFLIEYREEGRSVEQQTLNLTDREKMQLLSALSVNMQPENQVYRYNFFYDNCSTRPRDLVASSLEAPIVYHGDNGTRPTMRELIHSDNSSTPWLQAGEDLLLGIPADMSTTRADRQFLPARLADDFDSATVAGRKLVSSKTMILPQTLQPASPSPLTPRVVMWALLVVCIAIRAVEIWLKRHFLVWDVLLLTVTTAAGLVLMALLFSQHPCVRPNLMLLILNPLPLLLWWKKLRRHFWQIQTALILLFLIGAIWQTYPVGAMPLALSLLTRTRITGSSRK